MHPVLLALVASLCALVWLALLVVTNFSALPVGAGLLAVLYISGGPADRGRRSARW